MRINLTQYKPDEKICDICSSLTGITNSNCIIQTYRYDHSSMISYGVVPFLFKEGKYLWDVKIETVTIGDLINTFPNILMDENGTIDIDFNNQSQQNEDFELKTARDEYWKLWKSEVKKWKDMCISLRDKRRFKHFLEKFNVSPMSIIQAVYLESDYNIDEFSNRFSCDEEVSCSVLKCLGYINKVNDTNKYSINGDFHESVRIICNNIDGIVKESTSISHINSMKLFLYHLYARIETFFETQKDKIAITTEIRADREEPAVGERKNYPEIIAYVAIIIVVFIFIVVMLTISREQKETWGALSDFLGALAGAIISGLAVILTTHWMINRNYKIDYHNERMQVLPVFSVQCFDKDDFNEYKEIYQNNSCKKIKITESGGMDSLMYMVCQNIGNGMAFSVSIYPNPDSPIIIDIHTVSINDIAVTELDRGSYSDLYIKYKDLYGNLYYQYVQINVSDEQNGIEVIEQPPELIMRTKRARYTQ